MMLPTSLSHRRRPHPATASIIKQSCCDRTPSHHRRRRPRSPSRIVSVAATAQRPRPSTTSLATSTHPPRRSCLAHKSVPRRPQERRHPTIRSLATSSTHPSWSTSCTANSHRCSRTARLSSRQPCHRARERESSLDAVRYLTSKRSGRRCPV